jgi:type III secretion protein R
MTGVAPNDIVSLALVFAALALVPLMVVTTTSFLKISLVMLVLRNAIGVQQVPPTLAIYGISLAMTAFVMAPTIQAVAKQAEAFTETRSGAPGKAPMFEQVRASIEPLRSFMQRFAGPAHLESMLQNARKLWPADHAKDAQKSDYLILVPAFVISELQAGYEIAFLIYIPFVVIDLLISNILMALGMQMVSPQTISIPLKLLLFVTVDGWSRLLNALSLSYA